MTYRWPPDEAPTADSVSGDHSHCILAEPTASGHNRGIGSANVKRALSINGNDLKFILRRSTMYGLPLSYGHGFSSMIHYTTAEKTAGAQVSCTSTCVADCRLRNRRYSYDFLESEITILFTQYS